MKRKRKRRETPKCPSPTPVWGVWGAVISRLGWCLGFAKGKDLFSPRGSSVLVPRPRRTPHILFFWRQRGSGVHTHNCRGSLKSLIGTIIQIYSSTQGEQTRILLSPAHITFCKIRMYLALKCV
jgi:hypothetical protein